MGFQLKGTTEKVKQVATTVQGAKVGAKPVQVQAAPKKTDKTKGQK